MLIYNKFYLDWLDWCFFYGVYNGFGKNVEKVTSGSDPALVSQERTLSLLPTEILRILWSF